jgi:two-component system, NtrC family, sensor histidine kinase PilS
MNARINGWPQYLDRLSALLNIARVSLLFSIMTFYVLTRSMDDPDLAVPIFNKIELYSWAILYGLLILFSMLVPRWQNQPDALPNVNAVVDITMIAWLMSMGGGVDSGFGILLLPFVGSACLFSRGRYPMIYAGYVTLLIIIITWLQISRDDFENISMRVCTIAIMLIAAVYFVAGLTAYVATSLARSQVLQYQQSQMLDSYRHLLDRAFNYVQEGVVVLDESGLVWLINRKAQNYFPMLVVDARTTLFRQVMHYWHTEQKNIFEMNCTLNGWPMRIHARLLQEANTPLLMLSMRSRTEIDQESMAIKLASLGQLTANLAHEIRNPMSAVRQANELLQEEERDPVRLKLFHIVDNNISRIDKMLEDINMLNKRDKKNKQAIDLHVFWSAFVQEFVLIKPQAVNCIQLQADSGHLIVWCDSVHLQQIMWNLMNNAWRHSLKDKQAIRVVMHKQEQQKISITVIDNGAGVSAENQLHLFEPFFTTEASGTGLGLYVARELAQANHGQLNYRSQLNGFELTLPRMVDE